jgi:hypothetical protein
MTSYKLAAAILLTACTEMMGQTSFWPKSTAPATPQVTDTASVSLGLKFYSLVPGSVTAVRFYKGSQNTGTHVGSIWSSSGTNLGNVTFSNETASGWQEATFASPVPIAAKTTYTVSYLAPRGYYAMDQRYAWSSLSNTSLRVSGTTPSVYKYGAASSYPSETWNASNYWVDVVFVPAAPPVTTFSISGKVSGSAATVVLSGSTARSTTTDSLGNYTFSGVSNGSYSVTANQPGYTFTPQAIPVSVNGASINSANFTGIVASSTTTSFWPDSPAPATLQVSNTASVTLGLMFTSDVPGMVTGIRFYKGVGNVGTHIGSLWSSTGTNLASVMFTGETAGGWQQANFSSPVTIAANTTYVVSYLAPNGSHAHDQNYGWSNISKAPLRVAGASPGVYAYGSGAVFPGSSWNNSNYWVDVVFSAGSASTTPAPTYNISGKVSGSAATMTLSGPVSRSSNTDSSGNFGFTGLPNGSYIVAPSQPGYSFSPATGVVTVNNASITGVSFVGTAVPAPIPHSVVLGWNASTSSNVAGYNIYRADVAGGAYARMNATPTATTSFVDNSVASGRTYYYVSTAVDSNNTESTYSSQAVAVVPTP